MRHGRIHTDLAGQRERILNGVTLRTRRNVYPDPKTEQRWQLHRQQALVGRLVGEMDSDERLLTFGLTAQMKVHLQQEVRPFRKPRRQPLRQRCRGAANGPAAQPTRIRPVRYQADCAEAAEAGPPIRAVLSREAPGWRVREDRMVHDLAGAWPEFN